jgi:hypothetical protein
MAINVSPQQIALAQNGATPMAPTPMASNPYDYQVAQQILAEKYGLANALLATKQAPNGTMNQADIGGDTYDFFSPNYGGMVQSAGQRVLGGLLLNKANQSAQADVGKQEAAFKSAMAMLQGTPTIQQNPVSGETQITANNINNQNALLTQQAKTNPQLKGLQYINIAQQQENNPNLRTESLVTKAPSQFQKIAALEALSRVGPMGQAVMQGIEKSAFSPWETTLNTVNGQVVQTNPYEPGVVLTHGGGLGPKQIASAQTIIDNTVFKNPAAVAHAYYLLNSQFPGFIPKGQTLQQFAQWGAGSQSTPTQIAQQNYYRGYSNEANANAAYINGPKTQNTEAETAYTAGPKSALTWAQRQEQMTKSGLNVATQHNLQTQNIAHLAQQRVGYDTDYSKLYNLNRQLGVAQNAVQKFQTGPYAGVKGEWQKWVAGNPTLYQEIQQSFNNTDLFTAMSDAAGSVKGGAQLLQAYKKDGMSVFDTPQTLQTFVQIYRKAIGQRMMADQSGSNAATGQLQSWGWDDPNYVAPWTTPHVANTAEYNALPSGTHYVDPNGIMRIKP